MLFPASSILAEGYSTLTAVTMYLVTLSGYLFCEVILGGGVHSLIYTFFFMKTQPFLGVLRLVATSFMA